MITAQQAADQAAELKQIRQELAYIARALSPWIEMAEMCQRYGVCSKTLLAMERRRLGEQAMTNGLKARCGRWRA